MSPWKVPGFGSETDRAGNSYFEAVDARQGRFGERPWADVRAYGAAGDGRTDDIDAFEAARDALSPGGVVFVSPSDDPYLLGRYFDLKGRQLVGPARGAATVKADPESTDSAWTPSYKRKDLDDGVLVCINDRDVTIRGIRVDVSGKDAAGIIAMGGEGYSFLDNEVVDAPDSGIQFWGQTTSGIAPCRDSTMRGNVVHEAEWSYVWDGAVAACSMIGNHSYDPSTAHVHVDTRLGAGTVESFANVVSGNVFRGGQPGAKEAIRLLKGTTTEITIVGNAITDYPHRGMLLQGDATIVGNTFRTVAGAVTVNAPVDGGSRFANNRVVDATTGLSFETEHPGFAATDNSWIDTSTIVAWNGNFDESYTFRGNVDASGTSVDPTRATGSVRTSDGDTIAHDLPAAPDLSETWLRTNSPNRAYVKAVDRSAITVGLVDPAGNAVTVDERVQYGTGI